VVVEWASWRWAFAAPALIAAIAVVLAPRVLPAGPGRSGRRLDVPGAVLATAGLSALCYGLVEAGEHAWTSPAVLLTLTGGAGLLAAFVVVEARTRTPLLPPAFFASRRRLTGLAAVLLASSGTTAVGFFLPLYFQQVRGFSPAATSAAFLPYALAMFTTGRLAGRLVPRAGHRLTTVAGLLVGAAGLALLAGMDVTSPYVGAVLAGMVAFPVGASLLFSGGTVASVEDVPDDQAGLAGGVLNTAMEGGPGLGFAVLVSLSAGHASALRAAGVATVAATTAGYAFALGLAAAAYLLVAVVAAVTLRSRSPRAPRASERTIKERKPCSIDSPARSRS